MEDGGYRTNQRLECFIKRHLGQNVSDSLRISEPCIVVGENYGHAFKFAALTNDRLFILANPPQTENDIELTIELQHITEIIHVHDIPDFLSGDLQKNAQHCSITYSKRNSLSDGETILHSSKSTQRTEKNANSDRNDFTHRRSGGSRSSKSNEEEIGIHKGISNESNRTSTIRFKFDDCTEQQGLSPLLNNQHTAIEPPVETRSLRGTTHKQICKTLVPSEGSPTPGRSRPLPPPAPGTEKTNASTFLGSPNLRVSGRRRKSTEGKRPKEDSSAALRYNLSEPHHLQNVENLQSILSNQSVHSSNRFEQKLDVTRVYSSSQEDYSKSSQTTSSLSASFSSRIGNIFGKSDDKRSPKDLATNLKTQSPKSGENTDDDVFDTIGKTLHLYLINGDSHMISLLRTTRINSIITLTLEMKPGREKPTVSDSSKILEEFHQLKEEIMKCTEIENAFILTKELLIGCKKRPFLKKLFWKTDELLNHFITILDAYLINSHQIKMTGDEADQLDFMLLIAELMIEVIFNTEIFPSRNRILFGHRGSAISKMLKISLLKRDFLKKKETFHLSTAAASLLAGLDYQHKQSEKELELVYLLGEWSDTCSALTYELLNAAEQCRWTYRDGKGVYVRNLIDIMDNHPNIEPFLNDMVQRIMERLTNEKWIVKPVDVVLLFKQFSLLGFIFDNSLRLSTHLTDNYYEEFRYYIGSPKSMDRIPNCPLSPILSTLITSVSSYFTS